MCRLEVQHNTHSLATQESRGQRKSSRRLFVPSFEIRVVSDFTFVSGTLVKISVLRIERVTSFEDDDSGRSESSAEIAYIIWYAETMYGIERRAFLVS